MITWRFYIVGIPTVEIKSGIAMRRGCKPGGMAEHMSLHEEVHEMFTPLYPTSGNGSMCLCALMQQELPFHHSIFSMANTSAKIISKSVSQGYYGNAAERLDDFLSILTVNFTFYQKY